MKEKLFKKPLAVLLAAVIVLSALPIAFSAVAEEPTVVHLASFDSAEKMQINSQGTYTITANTHRFTNELEGTEGDGALVAETTRTRPALTVEWKDISLDLSKGLALRVRLYVTNPSAILRVYADISSSGVAGKNGLRWIKKTADLKKDSGWQELEFRFENPTQEYGDVDLSNVNYLRLYLNSGKGGVKVAFDDLYLTSQEKVTQVFGANAMHQGINYFTDAPSLLSTKQVQEGTGSYALTKSRSNSDIPQFSISSSGNFLINMSSVNGASVGVWLYLDEASLANTTSVTLELTSSGKNDVNEYQWIINTLYEGWHQYRLNFGTGTDYNYAVNGTPNSKALNFLRVFTNMNAPATVYVDNICIYGDCTVTNTLGYRQEVQTLAEDSAVGGIWKTNDGGNQISTDRVARGTASYVIPVCSGKKYGKIETAGIYLKLNDPSNFQVQFRVRFTDVSHVSSLSVELTSSGKCDYNERQWDFGKTKLGQEDEWKTLSFNGATGCVDSTGNNTAGIPYGSPDLTQINYMRFHFAVDSADAPSVMYLDDFRIISNSTANRINVATGDLLQPQVIKTAYSTLDTVVSDLSAVDMGADPTGDKDSTVAIQSALNTVGALGGGTVWLPAGKYRVTGHINIPAQTTLRGDWNDPDTAMKDQSSYGTVILADVPAATTEEATEKESLFFLNQSSGAVGLTVYYPKQSLTDQKPYGYTFYLSGARSCSVQNCTVLNGYRGIGAGYYYITNKTYSDTHDLLHIENFYGTFLKCGLDLYAESDVDTYKNIYIASKYWENAIGDYACKSGTVSTYTRDNATGMRLGDLEWAEMTNLNLSELKIGIHADKGRGSGRENMFAASVLGLTTANCNVGVQTDYMDARWGLQISDSSIAGSSKAVINNTTNKSVIQMNNVSLTGGTSSAYPGNIITRDTSKSNHTVPEANHAYRNSANLGKYASLYNVLDYGADNSGRTDASTAIQAALNAAGANGGGTVYLPAGYYRMTAQVKVPANVELRGSSPVAQRDYSNASAGTILLSYFEGVDDSKDTGNDALILLNGDYAGVSGIKIVYPQHYQVGRRSLDDYSAYKSSVAVFARNAHVYAVNCVFMATYRAIDFRCCDYHYIKQCAFGGFAYDMMVGGKDGMIEGCLQNSTVLTRIQRSVYQLLDPENFSEDKWASEAGWKANDPRVSGDIPSTERSDMFYYDMYVTRNSLTFILVNNDGCKNGTTETISSCFAYGAHRLIDVNKSASGTDTVVNAVNIGADGMISGGDVLAATNSCTLTVQNLLWYNKATQGDEQTLYAFSGSPKLRFYNMFCLYASGAYMSSEARNKDDDFTKN